MPPKKFLIAFAVSHGKKFWTPLLGEALHWKKNLTTRVTWPKHFNQILHTIWKVSIHRS